MKTKRRATKRKKTKCNGKLGFICLKSDFDERRECENIENVGDGTIFGETHSACVCPAVNREIITNWREKSDSDLCGGHQILWSTSFTINMKTINMRLFS